VNREGKEYAGQWILHNCRRALEGFTQNPVVLFNGRGESLADRKWGTWTRDLGAFEIRLKPFQLVQSIEKPKKGGVREEKTIKWRKKVRGGADSSGT